MINLRMSKLFLTLTVAVLLIATNSLAQTRSQVYGSDLDKQTMTFSFQGDFGLTTFESQAAESKETAETATATLSAYAGEARKFAISLRSSQNNVNFALNQNGLNSSWFDVFLKWRLWLFTPSITAGLTQLKIIKDQATYADFYAQSLGAGLDFSVPLFNRAVATASYFGFYSPDALDRGAKDIKMENRNEVDLNASIDITERTIDLILGYRTRSYKLTIDDKTFEENNQGAYAGLRVGLYF